MVGSSQFPKEIIRLSKELGANKYAVHAGFLIDIATDEIGKKLSPSSLSQQNGAIKKLIEGWIGLGRSFSFFTPIRIQA